MCYINFLDILISFLKKKKKKNLIFLFFLKKKKKGLFDKVKVKWQNLYVQTNE